MKKHIKNTFIISLAAIIFSACGGGGGDGDDARNFSGLWRGTLTKISDTCSNNAPNIVIVSHSVAQNEDAISLQSETGVTYLGNGVGQDGFSVDSSQATSGSSGCTDQTRIEYDGIDDDDDPSADVSISINRTCGTSTSSCEIRYSGTLSRGQVAYATPVSSSTPIAGTTPTPIVIAGGCSAINPKTVAGGFLGDGGCGISRTNYTSQGPVVTLEPFGSNGLTSFNIDSANSALANSQRQDLSIMGIDGYQCSIICSPPSTFSVRCTKEGGSSCIEKF